MVPSCKATRGWCEGDYFKDDWVNRASTNVVEGCLICPFHHHQAHRQDWFVRTGSFGLALDGIGEVKRPGVIW